MEEHAILFDTKIALMSLQIEAEMLPTDPSAAQQRNFNLMCEQVDHQLERVAGLLRQSEQKQEASV